MFVTARFFKLLVHVTFVTRIAVGNLFLALFNEKGNKAGNGSKERGEFC